MFPEFFWSFPISGCSLPYSSSLITPYSLQVQVSKEVFSELYFPSSAEQNMFLLLWAHISCGVPHPHLGFYVTRKNVVSFQIWFQKCSVLHHVCLSRALLVTTYSKMFLLFHVISRSMAFVTFITAWFMNLKDCRWSWITSVYIYHFINYGTMRYFVTAVIQSYHTGI